MKISALLDDLDYYHNNYQEKDKTISIQNQ